MSHYDINLAQEVGSRLRRLRLAAGLTKKELAPKAGLHPETIATTEAGTAAVTTDTFLKIVGALGVPGEQILDGLEWIEPTRKGAPGSWHSTPAAPAVPIAA